MNMIEVERMNKSVSISRVIYCYTTIVIRLKKSQSTKNEWAKNGMTTDQAKKWFQSKLQNRTCLCSNLSIRANTLLSQAARWLSHFRKIQIYLMENSSANVFHTFYKQIAYIVHCSWLPLFWEKSIEIANEHSWIDSSFHY